MRFVSGGWYAGQALTRVVTGTRESGQHGVDATTMVSMSDA
jgi:hypothetical protein